MGARGGGALYARTVDALTRAAPPLPAVLPPGVAPLPPAPTLPSALSHDDVIALGAWKWAPARGDAAAKEAAASPARERTAVAGGGVAAAAPSPLSSPRDEGADAGRSLRVASPPSDAAAPLAPPAALSESMSSSGRSTSTSSESGSESESESENSSAEAGAGGPLFGAAEAAAPTSTVQIMELVRAVRGAGAPPTTSVEGKAVLCCRRTAPSVAAAACRFRLRVAAAPPAQLRALAAAPGGAAQLVANGVVACRFSAAQLGDAASLPPLPLLKYAATSAAAGFARGLALAAKARAADDGARGERRVDVRVDVACDDAALGALRAVRVRVFLPPGFAPRALGAGVGAAAVTLQAQPSGAAFSAAERSLAWTLPRLPTPGEAPLALKARLTFDATAAGPPRPGAARHPTAQLATVRVISFTVTFRANPANDLTCPPHIL